MGFGGRGVMVATRLGRGLLGVREVVMAIWWWEWLL